VTGLEASAVGGSVGFTISVALTGISAQGAQGTVGKFYWTTIVDSEDANWQNIVDSQTANWAVINNPETANWQVIDTVS
jgi:hypothetical protein